MRRGPIFSENQTKAKQHPEAELLLFKIVRFLHPRYHPNIIQVFFFYQKKVYKKMGLKNLKEILRKSPASND